jgi:hypothetical protein
MLDMGLQDQLLRLEHTNSIKKFDLFFGLVSGRQVPATFFIPSVSLVNGPKEVLNAQKQELSFAGTSYCQWGKNSMQVDFIHPV